MMEEELQKGEVYTGQVITPFPIDFVDKYGDDDTMIQNLMENIPFGENLTSNYGITPSVEFTYCLLNILHAYSG